MKKIILAILMFLAESSYGVMSPTYIGGTIPSQLVDVKTSSLTGGRTASVVIAASDSRADMRVGATVVCDGLYDTNTINKAIAGGGNIFFAKGTYHVRCTPLLPVSNSNLIAENGAMLIMDKGETWWMDFNAIQLANVSNVRISGFTIDGNNTDITGGYQYGIYTYADSNNIEIDHCVIRHLGRLATANCEAISPMGWYWNIHDCTIYDTVDGINPVGNTYYSTAWNIWILNTNRDYPINAGGLYNCNFHHIFITNSHLDGIKINGCYNTVFDNISISDCNYNGILMSTGLANGISDVTISNCNIQNCGTAVDNTCSGISVSRAGNGSISNITLKDNKIKRASTGNGTKYGIYIQSSVNVQNARIIGNDCAMSGKTADLYFGPNAVNTIHYGNIETEGLE